MWTPEMVAAAFHMVRKDNERFFDPEQSDVSIARELLSELEWQILIGPTMRPRRVSLLREGRKEWEQAVYENVATIINNREVEREVVVKG